MKKTAILALIDRSLTNKKWDDAIIQCQQVLQSNPDWAEGYQRLGQAWTGLGELEQAIQAYNQSLRLQPNQRQIYAELGYLYHQSQQWPKAIAHYQKALTFDPHWVEVGFNLAMLYQRFEDWGSAIAQYQQVLSLKPDHIRARFNLALLYEELGSLDEAAHHYRQVVDYQPDHLNAWSNLGTVLFFQEKYQASLEVYQSILALNSDSAQVYNNMGQVYLAQNNLEQGMLCYQKAIALDPHLLSAQRALGKLWLSHQHYTKAQSCFLHLREQCPNNLEVLQDLASVYIALGNWAEALDCLRAIVLTQPRFIKQFCQRLQKSDPTDAYEIAQFECGQFLEFLGQGEIQQSLESLSRCCEFLGQALLVYGGLSQAEHYFHQALQLTPQNPALYAHLGACLTQQKRFNAAIAMLHLGLTIHPDQSLLLDSLQSLQSLIEQTKAQNHPPQRAMELSSVPLAKSALKTQDWVTAVASLPHSQPTFIRLDPTPASSFVFSEIQPDESSFLVEPSHCGGVTCARCMGQLIKRFEPIPIGNHVFRCSMTPKGQIPPPESFVVEVPHGAAFIAPQINQWMICKDIAIVTENQVLLSDLSRFYPWYLPGCVVHDMSQHPIFSKQNFESEPTIDGRVAVLSGLSGHVYYHWMIDVLPRIGLLQASGKDLKTFDGFVVNSLSKSFQRETLETLGIALEKVIESDRHPAIRATKLVVPSFPGYLDWVPQRTIDFLRGAFLNRAELQQFSRIYLSRAGANYRQVVNEPEIIQLLESYGFVSLQLETFSVNQQAALFSNADIIVAPHGAALTNLVFCRPGTTVIEFFSPNYIRTDYWMISHQLGLEHYYIQGKGFDGEYLLKLMHQNPLTEDMWITVESLFSAMSAIGLNRK